MNITSIGTSYTPLRSSQNFGQLKVELPKKKYNNLLNSLDKDEKDFLLGPVKEGYFYNMTIDKVGGVSISSNALEHSPRYVSEEGSPAENVRRAIAILRSHSHSSDSRNNSGGGWEVPAPTYPFGPGGGDWGF